LVFLILTNHFTVNIISLKQYIHYYFSLFNPIQKEIISLLVLDADRGRRRLP